jgi:hypothetical protein
MGVFLDGDVKIAAQTLQDDGVVALVLRSTCPVRVDANSL